MFPGSMTWSEFETMLASHVVAMHELGSNADYKPLVSLLWQNFSTFVSVAILGGKSLAMDKQGAGGSNANVLRDTVCKLCPHWYKIVGSIVTDVIQHGQERSEKDQLPAVLHHFDGTTRSFPRPELVDEDEVPATIKLTAGSPRAYLHVRELLHPSSTVAKIATFLRNQGCRRWCHRRWHRRWCHLD